MVHRSEMAIFSNMKEWFKIHENYTGYTTTPYEYISEEILKNGCVVAKLQSSEVGQEWVVLPIFSDFSDFRPTSELCNLATTHPFFKISSLIYS